MDYRYLTLFASGILTVLSSKFQAPGIITLNLKYQASKVETHIEKMSLFLVIKNGKDNSTVYSKTDSFKRINDDYLEITFSFEIYNISEILKYGGKFFETSNNGNKVTYEINEKTIEYNVKNTVLESNGAFISNSLYSIGLERDFDMFLSAKCREHFYPEYNCTVMCFKTENTEKCDTKGNKICKKGFYLNKNSGNCENDWCFLSADGCKNNGKCVNEKNKLSCICSPIYTGTHCENYKNLCQDYKCPNNTFCSIKDEKINCVMSKSRKITYDTKGDFTNLMSMRTLFSIFGFTLVFIITIAITVWACNNPKSLKNRSRETSIHSALTYYPNNSLSKVSKYCYHCEQDNLPFLNTYHSLYGNKAYYSLKHPHNRLPLPINRAFSDLMLSYGDRVPSMKSVIENEELMPLPPPLENHEEEIML